MRLLHDIDPAKDRNNFGGECAGIRTLDLLIKSQLLYRLSYALPKERAP